MAFIKKVEPRILKGSRSRHCMATSSSLQETFIDSPCKKGRPSSPHPEGDKKKQTLKSAACLLDILSGTIIRCY